MRLLSVPGLVLPTVSALALALAAPAASATDTCVSVCVSECVVTPGQPVKICVKGPPGQLMAILANVKKETTVFPGIVTLSVSLDENLRHGCEYIPPDGKWCTTVVFDCDDPWVGKTVYLQAIVVDPKSGEVCASKVKSFKIEKCKHETFTQGGWGSKPCGNNPGKVLANGFAKCYPKGVEIGIAGSGGHSLLFTSAKAIEEFLPTGGTPGKLAKDETNPKDKTAAGVLAGQVLALRLNVDFSAKGLIPGGNSALGTLELKGTGYGSIDGKTVAQVLALAETALGGGALPAGLTYSGLNDLVTNLNEAFDDGNASSWAKAHLKL